MQVNSVQSFMLAKCKPQPKMSSSIASSSNYVDRGAQLLSVGPANVLGMAFTGNPTEKEVNLMEEILPIYKLDMKKVNWDDNNSLRPIYVQTTKAIKDTKKFVQENPESFLEQDVTHLENFHKILKRHIVQNALGDFYDYFDKDCRQFDEVLGTYEDVDYHVFTEEKLQDLHKKATNIVKDLSLKPNSYKDVIDTMNEEKTEVETWLKIKSMSDKELHDALAEDLDAGGGRFYDEYFNARGLDISEFINEDTADNYFNFGSRNPYVS